MRCSTARAWRCSLECFRFVPVQRADEGECCETKSTRTGRARERSGARSLRPGREARRRLVLCPAARESERRRKLSPTPSAPLPAPESAEAGYTASDIEVLEGLEPVRRRPGMYIGGTDERALHHLFAEVIDNSMDEAVAGHASFIEVELEADGFARRHRQRPRHPGRPASEIPGQVGARGHHDHAARGRQVRLQGLRDLRRPARRRRLGGQRALRHARGRGRARPDSSIARPSRAARRRGRSRRSARCRTGAAPGCASIPTPRSSASAKFEPARLFQMARSKAYLFGGVEIRWRCAPALLEGMTDVPAEAMLPLPRRPARLSRRATSRASELVTDEIFAGKVDEARRPRLARMGGRLARRRGRRLRRTPTATPSRPPRAAPTRRACASRCCAGLRDHAERVNQAKRAAPSPPTT